MLSRIVQLTVEAQSSKPRLQRWLDKFGEHYSKAVVVLSFAVALMGPLLFKWPFFSTSGILWIYFLDLSFICTLYTLWLSLVSPDSCHLSPNCCCPIILHLQFIRTTTGHTCYFDGLPEVVEYGTNVGCVEREMGETLHGLRTHPGGQKFDASLFVFFWCAQSISVCWVHGWMLLLY